MDLWTPQGVDARNAHVAHYAGGGEQAVAAIDGPLHEEEGARLPRARILLCGELAFELDGGPAGVYRHDVQDRFVDMPAWVQEHLLSIDDDGVLPGRTWFGFVLECGARVEDLPFVHLRDAVDYALEAVEADRQVVSVTPR